jgi:hypothetical protein
MCSYIREPPDSNAGRIAGESESFCFFSQSLHGNVRIVIWNRPQLKSEGFWRWCVVICKSCFLDFVHRLYFNKITTFRKLDLLPSSGKKERQKPRGPTARVSVLPFLPEDGRISRFRNVVIVLKYIRWTKSKKPLLQATTVSSHNLTYSFLIISISHSTICKLNSWNKAVKQPRLSRSITHVGCGTAL